MFNLFKNIWEYLFFPWSVEIIEEGRVKGTVSSFIDVDRPVTKRYVIYKYSHRFRPQVKIVKKYLN